MSIRKEIRKRVAAVLQNATSAADRVHQSRMIKIKPETLPCILVYTNKEDCEVYDTAPKSYKKTLSLDIEIVAEGNALLDDTLDDICNQVEAVFNEDQHLGAPGAELVDDIELSGTSITLDPTGEVLTGSAVMVIKVTYVEDAVASGTVEPHTLDPFESIYMDTKPLDSLADSPVEKDGIELTQ